MGWTAPRDWITGETVTEAMMDTHVKDNLRYLKGLDGAVTLSDALILPDGAGYYLHIPILTTTQRDALTPTAGMLIYNSTLTQFNKYENGAWRADLGFNSHHGDMSGLTDDDHTQYQKENLLTTAGDLTYATAASTWARLGIGTALQILRTNAGATAPEWAAVAPGISINTGTYAGASTANKAIAHGLGVIPKFVSIFADSSVGDEFVHAIQITGLNKISGISYITGGSPFVNADTLAVTAMDATNFYVGNATDYVTSANLSGINYYWVAMS